MGSWPKDEYKKLYTVGEYGCTVTIFTPSNSPHLYYRTSQGSGSLKKEHGITTLKEARAWAKREAARLEEGLDEIRAGKCTLRRLFRLYLKHRTPDKAETTQRADRRRAEMWKRVLGEDQDAAKISLGQWQEFKWKRAEGAIDARGHRVPPEDRDSVRPRTVVKDLTWLQGVLNWGTRYYDTKRDGYLLEENICRGYPVPEDKNPRQEEASLERVRKVRGVTDEVMMEIRWRGKRETVPSYLSELFDIAVFTGHRIGAVCALHVEDLYLEPTESQPYGAILWRAETDKSGRRHATPIGPLTRAALERARDK